MSRRPSLVFVAALGVVGCGERRAAAPALADAGPALAVAGAAAADASSSRPADASVVGARTIGLEEVKAVLPVPAEARVITPHAKAQGQERVNVAFCFDRLGVEQAGERVGEKLTAAGWQVRRAGADLHATREGMRLDGMVRRGPWEGCLGTKGQTYVALGVYR